MIVALAAFFLPSEGRSRADEGRAAAHPGVDQLVGNGTTNSILGIRTLLGPAALPVETCLTRHQPCTLLAAHTLLAALQWEGQPLPGVSTNNHQLCH